MNKRIVQLLKTLLLPVGVYTLFLIFNFQRFGNFNTVYIIFLQTIIPTIIAYSISFGYITGIFDFSIGSRVIITGLVGGIVSSKFGMPGLIIGCLCASLVLAAFTGVLHLYLRIPSLVLTMGLAMVYEVAGKKISGRFSFVRIDYDYSILGNSPYIVIVFVAILFLFYFIFNRTKFSYEVRAVGSNESVANTVGMNTALVKFLTFIVGSFFIAVAALLMISQSGSMGAQVNLGSIVVFLKPLMSVVIAIVLQPVFNLTWGIFISLFTINTIFLGLIAAGISDTFQNVFLGTFLLIVMIISNNYNRLKIPKKSLLLGNK